MANAPGVPTWVDLSTTDLKGATGFYTQLFGWDAEVTPEPEAGGYTTYRIEGNGWVMKRNIGVRRQQRYGL